MPTRVMQEVDVPATTAAEAPPRQREQQQLVAAPAASHARGRTRQAALAPVLNLSFGGVDFALLPKRNEDGSVTFETMGANEAVLSLKNFTGKLRVTCTAPTNWVEDSTSPSPEKLTQDAHHRNNNNNNKSPTQQQISSWTQKKTFPSPKAASTAAAVFTTTSQAPTPPVVNGKKRSSSVEQVMAANRSSPLPYHSPLKRSRSTSRTSSSVSSSNSSSPVRKRATPLSQRLPPSPISMRQKSQSETIVDCSQTQSSQADTTSTSTTNTNTSQGEDHEMQDASSTTIIEETGWTKTKDSVQDIMKRNEQPSSGSENEDDEEEESVATKQADDFIEEMDEDSEEEDEDETQLPSGNPPNSSTKEAGMTKVVSTTAIVSNKKPENKTPSPRWGHTMTMVGNNRALVYGGQSFDPETGLPKTLADVFVFDVEKQKWLQPVNSESSQKWPRQWHSATFLPQRQLLICFGGEAANPKTGRVTTSDKNNTMVLDTEIMLWYPPSVSGEVPSGRSGHTATLLPSSSNNELIVFGGVKGSKWLNSVSVLDTSRWVWSSPKIQGVAPKARSYHSAIAVQANVVSNEFEDDDIDNKNASVKIQSRVVIFGGNDATSSFNTVHVLEKTEGTQTTWRWFHPTVTGENIPKARTGHSATLMEDGKTICIYGGWDPNAEDEDDTENKNPANDDNEIIFNDCYLLDTESWTWKTGPAPVFAGVSLDPSQGENGGARRVGHTVVLNQSNNEVLVFGGRIPGDRFTGDFQTLTMS